MLSIESRVLIKETRTEEGMLSLTWFQAGMFLKAGPHGTISRASDGRRHSAGTVSTFVSRLFLGTGALASMVGQLFVQMCKSCGRQVFLAHNSRWRFPQPLNFFCHVIACHTIFSHVTHLTFWTWDPAQLGSLFSVSSIQPLLSTNNPCNASKFMALYTGLTSPTNSRAPLQWTPL